MSQRPVKFPEEKEFLDLADNLLGKALEGEGLEGATLGAQTFVSMEEGSGIGLSKYLHGVNFRWSDFDKEDGDTFQKWAHRATGRNVATIQRSVCVWEWLTGDYIPGSFHDSIWGFNVKMLKRAYKISLHHKNNRRTGNLDFIPSNYKLSPVDWRNLAECTDEGMLIEVLDKITNSEPNSNRNSFSCDDDGNIWYFHGKGDGVIIGQLFNRSDVLQVQQGLAVFLEKTKMGVLNGV